VARVSRADQINRFLAGLQVGGAAVLSCSAESGRPVALRTTLSDGSVASAVIYCWNIRHSGGGRSAEERRVQMTGVPRPSLYPARGPVPLLLGYEEDEDVFAAWDATKHRHTLDPAARGGSNSIYIPHAILLEARQLGFASHERVVGAGVSEVVVAFRPDAADQYLRVASALRPTGQANVTATARAARGAPVKRAGLTATRVKVLRQVQQVVRSARFPGEVLSAYNDRCAFCGLGAKLVHAAHIKSVRDGGPDDVTNGLALCPTHHAAFDRFLVVVADDFTIAVNRRWATLLEDRDVQKLRGSLRKRLAVPKDPQLRPDLRFVRFHRSAAAR
jgi:putative restriction endonuclease